MSPLLVFVFAMLSSASAQTAGPGRVAWGPPPGIMSLEVPAATVPNEMLTTLRVSDVPVVLESTKLVELQKRLGGRIGHRGDAGNFVEWLCFQGAEGNRGWVLWLESGEIHGGTVGGFRLQRMAAGARPDRRCRLLPRQNGVVQLPTLLRLGLTESKLMETLGQPTAKRGDELIYVHEHVEQIRGEPYTSTNSIAVIVRHGVVWAIEVWKTTAS